MSKLSEVVEENRKLKNRADMLTDVLAGFMVHANKAHPGCCKNAVPPTQEQTQIINEVAGLLDRPSALEALHYIDGWIDHYFAVYIPLVPAARSILDEMRVHIRAAVARLERGERMEATTPLG